MYASAAGPLSSYSKRTWGFDLSIDRVVYFEQVLALSWRSYANFSVINVLLIGPWKA